MIKNLPQKLTRSLLLVLLLPAGSTFFAQKALSEETNSTQFPPELIKKWKDYLQSYPQRLADYYKKQKERRETAKQVVFSQDMSIEDALKAYPFLLEDFKKVGEMQNKIANTPPPADQQTSTDISVHVRIGQDLDKTGNLLFVEKKGFLTCGMRGCESDIYLNQGNGYQKLTEILLLDSQVYVSRSGGQTFLYLAPPQDNKLTEWVLKNNQLVISQPPTKDPINQGYVEWRHEMMLKGEDPEANIPSPDHDHDRDENHGSRGDEHESHDHEQHPPHDDTLAPPEE